MKIAYLVLAHTNPQVLKRALTKLSTRDCAFFVHIDLKSDLEKFKEIEGENVIFSEVRFPVYWGEFSQVQAILQLLRQAIKSPQNFDRFILVSGSDYPLRSGEYIHAAMVASSGVEFMSLIKMPAPGKPLARINTMRFPSEKPVRRFVSRALAKIGLAQRDYRKYLGSLDPYSGSTWWALTREASQYIVDFVECNPGYAKFFKYTFAADEAFFHTILGNSRFKSLIRRNLVFEYWPDGGPHPEAIDERQIAGFTKKEAIMVSDAYGTGEALFARKFSDARLDLIDGMDRMIKEKG
jgi:hypothetical protein